MPARAVSSASATVAAGMVKSISAVGARRSSGAAIGRDLHAVLPSPASSPASRPMHRRARRLDRAHQRQPSLLSAMALISVRPMRPPAPATISRISDINSPPLPVTGCGPSIAFDDDQIADRVGLTDLQIGLIPGER